MSTSASNIKSVPSKTIIQSWTYNLGVDGHYLSEMDCVWAGLPTLRPLSKQVAVARL